MSHSHNMENVQHKFLRLDVKSSEYQMPFDSHNYDNVLNSLNLSTLSRRTIMSDIIFISEIAKGIVDCLDTILLLFLNVSVLRSLKSHLLFHTQHRTLYYNCINRIVNYVNSYHTSRDIFGQSIVYLTLWQCCIVNFFYIFIPCLCLITSYMSILILFLFRTYASSLFYFFLYFFFVSYVNLLCQTVYPASK